MKRSLSAWLLLGWVLASGGASVATLATGDAPAVALASGGAPVATLASGGASVATLATGGAPAVALESGGALAVALASGDRSCPHSPGLQGTLISAPLWDWRYGEAVLGRWGVNYTSSTAVTINGSQVAASALEKADLLRQVRGCAACARLSEQGKLERVDLIVPKLGAQNGQAGQAPSRQAGHAPSRQAGQAGAQTDQQDDQVGLQSGQTGQQVGKQDGQVGQRAGQQEGQAGPQAGQQEGQKGGQAGSIREVSVTPRVVQAGNPMEFTMRAAPGRQAAFFVAGLGQEVAAQEVAPGVYRARWQAPLADAQGLRVLGRIVEAEQSSGCWGESFDVVLTPPEISQWGARALNEHEVLVFAKYESAGTSIDPPQVQVWVNGCEVTGRMQRTDRLAVGVLPGAEVRPGALLCVKVTDQSGRSAKRYWRSGSADIQAED